MPGKAKRICIGTVQIPFQWGGAEILADTLLRQLKKRDYQVEIVRIPFKWYPKEEIIKSAFAWRLLDITESYGEKIDLVICTKFPSYVIKHPNKIAWVVHQHRPVYDLVGKIPKEGDTFEKETFFNYTAKDFQIQEKIIKMDTIALRECQKIYTISQNVSKRLEKYNGISSEPLYPPPRDFENSGNHSDEDYILYVGRLESIKRVELLVDAMRYVKSSAKCIIAGTGTLSDEFIKKAEKCGLSHKIRLTGYVDDTALGQLYANSLAVFYAPLDEDYGYVTVEAFRFQKPVITTADSGGVLEFVEDKMTGLITTADPQDIAQKIDFLYDNKSRCKEMGRAGFEKVKFISWDYVIQKLTETLG